jgi:hypothetical protein
MPEYKAGEYIIYQNGDRFELGKIKRVTADGAFVWYSEGDTAAKTPFDCMHKLMNANTIHVTTLGGQKGLFPLMPGDDVWFAIRDDVTGEAYAERDRVTGVGFEGFCCADTTDRPDSMGSPTAWSELGSFAFRTEPEALEAARRMKT